MSVIDVESLLRPVSPDTPCGEDLEYSGLMELERVAQGSAEQELGRGGAEDHGKHFVVAAREPNWAEVGRVAAELAGKTRDLRVILYLTRALVRTDGFPGLRDGLALLRGTIERYWECLYPVIDPEDQDPTFRVNTLAALEDLESLLRPLREAPIVSAAGVGRFSLRDLAVARGEVPPPEGGEPPTPATIEAAFRASDLGALQAQAAAVTGALEDLRAIDAAVTDHLGAGNATSFEKLPQLLGEAERLLREHLAGRGGAAGGAAAEPRPAGSPGAGPLRPPATAAPLWGEISSREDVVRVLDRVCEYYRRQEPSSPVPILLERAKRLVAKDFMAIIRDLAPAGLAEVEAVRGRTDEESQGS
jgi:type VI secretion system protein ImpA